MSNALDRKIAARRALINEADDLFIGVCELMGGDYEIERTAARAEIFYWVRSLPKFCHAARDKLWRETV